MKSAGKARNNGLYRHIRTSKEIIRNLLNDSHKSTNNKPAYNDIILVKDRSIQFFLSQKEKNHFGILSSTHSAPYPTLSFGHSV